jgi:ribosome-binding protein aMBF1 (putative translation factor)
MGDMTADDLGPRIRRARRRRKWSQQRLADEVGVALRTIGAWERGESHPRRDDVAIEDLEAALGVSLADPAEDYTDPAENERKLWALDLPAAVRKELVGLYRTLSAERRSA